MMSAWLACLAVSLITCSSTKRRLRCASGGQAQGASRSPLLTPAAGSPLRGEPAS
jgi:hypothetical protein